MQETFKYIRSNQNIFLAMMAASWFWFYATAFVVLAPIYAVVTYLIGLGLGVLIFVSLSKKRIELGLVPFGCLGMSIFALELYFAGPPILGTGSEPDAAQSIWHLMTQYEGIRRLLGFWGLGIFCGLYAAPLYAFIHLRVTPKMKHRVLLGSIIPNLFFMIAAACAIELMTRVDLSIPQIFMVLAAMNAAVAVYVYFYLPEFMLRFYAWIIASLMYRMKVIGHEHIPKDGPAVLICNHITFVDWLIIAAGVKRPLRFVMDHTFYKGFLARTILNQAKVIPIASARENPKILERAFERIAEELRAGEVVCIFPEGKITKNGEMNPFKPGIEKIISITPVPVVPMALKNLWGSYFSRSDGGAIKKIPKRFWSAIELEISEPISPDKVTAEDLFAIVNNMLR